MNKEQALRKLRGQLALIEQLKTGEIFSPEFTKWHRDTEVLIEKIFGEDSRHVKDFASIAYTSKAFFAEPHRSYTRGLDNACSILESLFQEIQEYWVEESRTIKSTAIDKPLGNHKYDAFICHASEDKDGFVRPLAERLTQKGLNVWYDEFTLKVGMKLGISINEGLLNSNYGIVVLSRHFFTKSWPQNELSALIDRQMSEKRTIILPIWHEIDKEFLLAHSPFLADTIAIQSKAGLDETVRLIYEAIGPQLEIHGSQDVQHSNFASFTIGAAVYAINGKQYVMEVAPYIYSTPDGRGLVFLPAHNLAVALGVIPHQIFVDSNMEQIAMVKGCNTIVLVVGNTTYMLNGEPRLMSVAPQIVNGQVMVPPRPIVEAFAAQSGWNPVTQTVILRY